MTICKTPADRAIAEAIAERNRVFESRFAASDARGLVESYFVEDAGGPMASPPGGMSLVRGRSALVALFTLQFKDARAIRLETIELNASDTIAHELGRAHSQLRSGDSAIGRYVVLWVRTSAGWRAKIDFFAGDGWSDVT